jgi:hypothetical protein
LQYGGYYENLTVKKVKNGVRGKTMLRRKITILKITIFINAIYSFEK